mmetsp:Transcript_538/g.1142  ORF Transcript_538/g.1142 Transcript_538/m.1142 type:complete len:113 (-) Transcript_538:534-872(-)
MAATAAPDVEWDSDYCWFLSLKQALGVERFGDGHGATGTGTILGHGISGIAVTASTTSMAVKPIPCKRQNACDRRQCQHTYPGTHRRPQRLRHQSNYLLVPLTASRSAVLSG